MPDTELIFELEGLGCANCAAKIEKQVKALPDISVGEVNFMQQSLRVVLGRNSRQNSLVSEIESIVHAIEPDVKVRRLTDSARSYKETGSEGKCEDRDGCDCG